MDTLSDSTLLALAVTGMLSGSGAPDLVREAIEAVLAAAVVFVAAAGLRPKPGP